MKLLQSFKKMLELVRDSDFEMAVLTEDKIIKYNGFEKKLTKGTSTWNCDDEMLGKILFMYSKINQAYESGVISLTDIVKVVFDVFEDKGNSGTAREEKKVNEQTKLGFN